MSPFIGSVVSWISGDVKSANKKEDFFDAMSRNVVKCFLAHLLSDPAAPPELKTLRSVRHAIAMPADQIRAVLRGICETSPRTNAWQLAGSVCGLVDETFSGVIGGTAEMTTWLANDAFANLVSGNTFKMADVLKRKVTVFLKMPMKALETEQGFPGQSLVHY